VEDFVPKRVKESALAADRFFSGQLERAAHEIPFSIEDGMDGA
jgi:hypothetical protein